MSSPPVLEAVNLRKVFPAPRRSKPAGDIVAVADLTFDLPAGGALGIVGESGAGKTTASAILMGFEPPTAGSVRIDGRDWTRARTRQQRKQRARDIQIVFQDPHSSLDPRQTVESALGEVLRLHFGTTEADGKDRVEELLDLVGLSAAHRQARPRQLSGGERQRVAIARALAARPRVVIFDESVAALDVSIQAQVLNLLVSLRTSLGLSYIFISHDLGVIRYATDETIVMRHGEVVEQGPTAQLLDRPQHPYTKLLRTSVPQPGWRPRRLLV